MFIFCHRTQKMSQQWAEKKKVQESLVRKLESMRGRVNGRKVNGIVA
jgi:hypothetical protein